MPQLSIVSSLYHTGRVLEEFVGQVIQAVTVVTTDYEIILVDDGSPDNAWELLEALSAGNPRIRGIKLSRNFGQHRALAAGLDACRGDYVVVMDSDLQDQPREIIRLYAEAKAGYPVVVARRMARTDGLLRRWASRLFYWLLSKMSGLQSDYTIANFGIYHKKVIDEVKRMRETDRFLPMLINWTGFKRKIIEVAHGSRKEGRSGYSMGRLLRLGFDVTLTYSDKPLRLAIKAGFVISSISFLMGIYTLVLYVRGKIVVLGYTSIVLSIWFMGGVILFTLGMVGVYIGKTYEGIKNRPLYIIEKAIN